MRPTDKTEPVLKAHRMCLNSSPQLFLGMESDYTWIEHALEYQPPSTSKLKVGLKTSKKMSLDTNTI
jgi:hypothetical protein